MAADLEFLRSVPLFMDLSAEDLEELKPILTERAYAKGETILRADETAASMYVVKTGGVKVVAHTAEGKEVLLALHGPGEFFGEMALIDGKTEPADVIAREPSQVIRIGKRDFEAHLMVRRPFVHALLRILSARCREAWVQVKSLSHYTAEARLRAILSELAEKQGRPENGGVWVDVGLTHQELATMAGVSREKVTRALGELERRGLLETGRGRIFIPDLARLTED